MPRPTYQVKRICYADDISVWASGAKISEIEVKINDYLKEMSEFLKSYSLLISAPKSTVTLFTPETKQAKYHPDIKKAGSQLPLNRSPKILEVHLDTSLTFNTHKRQQESATEVLKALAGTTWGQQMETILMTYKTIGKSVVNYSAHVWSTNASATSIDHLHNETEMLTVKQHSDHVYHNITTMDDPPRQMKHTLHTRYYPTVQPLLAATKKETLQAVHTEAVTRAINSQQPNRVLLNRPPAISSEEDTLRRPQRTTLS